MDKKISVLRGENTFCIQRCLSQQTQVPGSSYCLSTAVGVKFAKDMLKMLLHCSCGNH